MAETRLLSGKQCSVHFRHLEEFVARHPGVKVTTHEIFVIDGDAITCLPGTVAIDVAVKLIMRHSGKARALKSLPDLIVDEHRIARHKPRSL